MGFRAEIDSTVEAVATHLFDHRCRWKEKQAPVGKERKCEQHLEHPEHDIHAASLGVLDQGRS